MEPGVCPNPVLLLDEPESAGQQATSPNQMLLLFQVLQHPAGPRHGIKQNCVCKKWEASLNDKEIINTFKEHNWKTNAEQN